MTQSFKWPELPNLLHERQPWGRPNIEPSLCELLADPLLQSVMQSDGVSSAALESAISHTRQRLRLHGENSAKESPTEASASRPKPAIAG